MTSPRGEAMLRRAIALCESVRDRTDDAMDIPGVMEAVHDGDADACVVALKSLLAPSKPTARDRAIAAEKAEGCSCDDDESCGICDNRKSREDGA